MLVLLGGLIGLPLLAGIALCLWPRRSAPAATWGIVLFTFASAIACAIALLPYAGQDAGLRIHWLPRTGAIGLHLDATSLLAVLVTAGTGLLALLGEDRRQARMPLMRAVELYALAAASAAFLADHFLGRYVALELVALAVPLALLARRSNQATAQQARACYLLLRLGDAGLLTSIVILALHGGTLKITTALEAGRSLGATRLSWAVGGFILATWVKLGGWPFHLWSLPAGALGLPARGWLYAIVVPNLGAYLLYRVTPLLKLTGPWQEGVIWGGALGAAVAALLALERRGSRAAIPLALSAQGGLLLFLAAAGLKSSIWLALLVMAPLRLLLFLAEDAEKPRKAKRFLALGGLALAAFGLLAARWAREAGTSWGPIALVQAASALTGVWALSHVPQREGAKPTVWLREATLWLLGGATMAGAICFAPLTRWLSGFAQVSLPALPSLQAMLRDVIVAPGVWIALALALTVWQHQRRLGTVLGAPDDAPDALHNLEETSARAARALRATIELGLLEEGIALLASGVIEIARFLYRAVERGFFEDLVAGPAEAAMNGARSLYQVGEQQSLEDTLRHAVRNVVALCRIMQRWHTGRLRRNLLAVALSLLAALLVVFSLGWP